MDKPALPPSPLPELRVVELSARSESLLQRFFEENPLYFESVNGELPKPTAAHEEIHGAPPAGMPYTRKWVIGFANPEGELQAMVNIVSGLIATPVWHIGTFIVATSRHGNGDARAIYQGLESWARVHGAQWLRLGVVQGNLRAERFWERRGFMETRLRSGVSMGSRINTLRVMFKPLGAGSIAQYLALVERDRPES